MTREEKFKKCKNYIDSIFGVKDFSLIFIAFETKKDKKTGTETIELDRYLNGDKRLLQIALNETALNIAKGK